MNEIRRFVEAQGALKSPPQYYVLTQEDGTVLVSAAADDEPAEKIENIMKADLAFVTGGCNYVLMGQDNAGGVMARIRLRQHGVAPKSVASEASSVNGNLVALVGRLTSSTADHFEKLYKRQDDVIDALLGANKSMASALVDAVAEGAEPTKANPAVAVAEQRLGRLVEVGLGAAMSKLTAGQVPGSAAPPAVSMGGKHVRLRELVASKLSDEEIDAIISVVLSAGCGGQIMGALSTENYSVALEIMGA
jgi:hypothetical protein